MKRDTNVCKHVLWFLSLPHSLLLLMKEFTMLKKSSVIFTEANMVLKTYYCDIYYSRNIMISPSWTTKLKPIHFTSQACICK